MGRAIRKLAVFFSSFAAVFAVIGSGFAAWIFCKDGNFNSVSPHISVLVTEAVKEEGEYICDQLPALVVLDGGSYGGVYNTLTGINFYKAGYSGYDTANDKKNYEYNDDGTVKKDEDGNPIKSGTDEEILFDPTFTIYYQASEIADGDFGIRVEVEGFLTTYIEHSVSYKSYSTIASGGVTYLDLKALAEKWGEYGEEQTTDSEGSTVYRYKFQLTTSLLNTFFSYKEIIENDAPIDGIRRYQLILQKLQEGQKAAFHIYLTKITKGGN